MQVPHLVQRRRSISGRMAKWRWATLKKTGGSEYRLSASGFLNLTANSPGGGPKVAISSAEAGPHSHSIAWRTVGTVRGSIPVMVHAR